MGEGTRIFRNTNNQNKHRPEASCRLGEVVQKLLDERISPRQAGYGAIAEVWEQILPKQLLDHCEIADVTGGKLTVKDDSPSYKYELHLCSKELLEELQLHCPKLRLRKIKFILA